MPLDPIQIQRAEIVQHAAAQDPNPHIRLVAGPGTGKSSAIEERIRWLLAQNISPASIYAVSFTRASSLDLRQRVHAYCTQKGHPAAVNIRVTTLHSLALRTLRAAGLLIAYPVDPLVMDGWELENIFDAEFGHSSGIGKKRREKIRLEYEAFWSTGLWGPPNYVPPNPAISTAEKSMFSAFHRPRTQAYSCVLPGEIVGKCVEHMQAGVLNAVGLLGLQHLVVDEYQDLNPMDLRFVDEMVAQGARVFIAGDDDQSIYSFRFASPAGIQDFATRYPTCGQHTLSACFRCTPNVLAVGQTLISANQQPNRIPKTFTSLYSTATPPVNGATFRWRFANGGVEAKAIAESCRDLIAAGITPRDILVLLSNKRTLFPRLEAEFKSIGVAYEPPRTEGFLDSEAGRLVLALARIVCNADDYIALRVLLGIWKGVGIGTCHAVTDAVIVNNLNYKTIFYNPLPTGLFTGRALAAVSNARAVCSQLQNWQPTETVGLRTADIAAIISSALSPADSQAWQVFAATLPQDMLLNELRDFLWADTDEQQELLLQAVMTRLNLPIPPAGVLPSRVRVMTMHGAKGLSGKVVFIPGLEEEVLPGPWRQPFPGLVLEAARLLYVSITRARAACIISYAQNRTVNGRYTRQTPSRFVTNLGGPFAPRGACLTPAEVANILTTTSLL
jgi:superfamily I DNA/RNA helicase